MGIILGLDRGYIGIMEITMEAIILPVGIMGAQALGSRFRAIGLCRIM